VVTLSAKANFKKLGRLFGAKMKDASRTIEAFTAETIAALASGGSIDVLGTAITYDDIEIRRTKHEGVEVETQDGVTVALNTEITPELEQECSAREFVNRIQTLRKTRDFNVSDRIAIRCVAPEKLTHALKHFSDYICNETLAVSLSGEHTPDAGAAETVEINGMDADVQIVVVK